MTKPRLQTPKFTEQDLLDFGYHVLMSCRFQALGLEYKMPDGVRVRMEAIDEAVKKMLVLRLSE